MLLTPMALWRQKRRVKLNNSFIITCNTLTSSVIPHYERFFFADGYNATSSISSLAPTLEASTPMAVKSNEGRGRTGSLSGRARSLLLSIGPRSAVPRVAPWAPRSAPTRSLDPLSAEQTNFGISRGLLRIGTTSCSLPRNS